MSARRGAFILFEGVDRCGKTTQAKRLVASLNALGHDAEFRCFPDRTTTIGKIINQYLTKAIELDDKAVHLLFAANRWECAKTIRDTLEAGKTLVVDRYSHSGVAFSSVKDGMEMDWCIGAERGLPAPDVVIFLRLGAEDAAGRGGFGEERYETTEFQEKVRANYLRLPGADEWKFVNAAGTVEEVGERVVKVATAALEVAGSTPIAELWVEDETPKRGDGEDESKSAAAEE